MAGKKGQKTTLENNKRKWVYYKNLHPDWTEEQCKEAAKKFSKSCTYVNIEYYERFYPELSHEEHERMRQEKIYNMRKNNKSKIEYYIEHYPNATDEERYNMWHAFNQSRSAQSIKYYERKYPDATPEEREKMRQEYIKNYLENMPDHSGQNNPNSKTNTTEYERRSRSPRCIEFYQRKYPNATPDEQQKMLNKYFEENRLRIKNTIKDTNIEYYLNQGMSEVEAALALKNRQSTFSLNRCIEKYGEEEGERIFKERQKKWIKSLKKNFSDNGFTNMFQSKLGNLIITEILNHLGIDIKNADDYTEFCLQDYDDDRVFIYDFVFNDKLIEINGDYWHCNPKFYDETFYNMSKRKTAKEIWEIDARKKEIAEQNGYKLLVVWENDYNTNPTVVIEKCLEFLNV